MVDVASGSGFREVFPRRHMDISRADNPSLGPDAEPSAVLAADGTISALTDSMAGLLGSSPAQCVGRVFSELLPESQRATAEVLIAHSAASRARAMRVLEFSGKDGMTIASLVEATPPVAASSRRFVKVRVVHVQSDRDSLLIPFRMAAKAADLALFLYRDERLEWLGGSSSLVSLAPSAALTLRELVQRVHPEDKAALRSVLRAIAAPGSWTRIRFRSKTGEWRVLACLIRQIQLGYYGARQVIGIVRDETRTETQRQQLLIEVSSERERGRQIAAISSALINAATERELEQAVLLRIAEAFGGTGSLLAIVEQGHVHVCSDAGVDPGLARAIDGIPVDDPRLLTEAIRTGEPQFIPDREDFVRRWPGRSDLMRLSSAASIAIVPFTAGGSTPLGAWAVTSDKEQRLSADQRSLMCTLAGLAGQALKRIRLQQARLELAAAIQHTFLPSVPERLASLEMAARYSPAQDGLDIGGDWYDAFPLADGTVVLVIGDVQGHDVEAACFMGLLGASLRAVAAQERHPGAILARTNELLISMNAERFASCTVLRFDPRDGQATGATAGHVPLLWAREDGSNGIWELPAGPVLSVVAGAEYPQQAFDLRKGTSLIMVTDGLVEGPGLNLDDGLRQACRIAARSLHDGASAGKTADAVLGAARAVDHLDDAATLVILRT